MENINWLSIILATLTPMFIGFIYYHKAVFGKAWLDSIGMTDEKAKKANLAVTLSVSLVFSFLLSFFLLNFNNDGINQEGEFDTFLHGAWHGTFIAIIIVTPVIITNGLFERKRWKSMLINVFYWIITLALMGGILDVMNHWENIPMPVK
ncbi:hypothetical protein A9Q86_09935 [Flavobacteriales bacterium 33_180_T64]|mgnify:CR=1 FL=1|nr:hypothetical protein A9Q86_09935 [Flavobacteriales bacterium 33_180_T64]